MTSTAVTNVKNYTANAAAGSKTNAARKHQDSFMDCFSQAYGGQSGSVKAQDSAGPVQKDIRQDKPGCQTEIKKDKPKADEAAMDKGGETASIDSTGKPDFADDKLQDVEDASEEMVEAIASQLGIPVETVKQAMAEAGMSPADMLDMEQVTKLVVDLAADGDGAALLTDEKLYADVQQIAQKLDSILAELSSELKVSPEELKGMLEMAQQMAEDTDRQAEEAGRNESAEAMDGGIQSEGFIKPVKQEAAVNQQAVNAGTADKAEAQQEPVVVVENEKPLEATGKQTADSGSSTGQESSGKESNEGREEGNSYLDTLNGQPAGKPGLEAAVKELSESVRQAPDTADIMKQITDYMKIQVRADMTKMEIQLHPASLGNVNVQISAREGVITAQFTTQNEAVKNALEAQIVQLRENLAEQGVKVEAIEVTIASHGFERNLQQGNGGQGDARQQKKTARRLNLNMASMEEADMEGMEDAEKISADMMARNGNTVDFSA